MTPERQTLRESRNLYAMHSFSTAKHPVVYVDRLCWYKDNVSVMYVWEVETWSASIGAMYGEGPTRKDALDDLLQCINEHHRLLVTELEDYLEVCP